MSMSSTIVGSRRVKVWEADADWPDDVYVVPAEDHDLVTVDRDIKAANMQLLVEKVLAAVPCIDDVADCAELRELEELARGLKQ